jgi:hypothetical protein
MEQLAQTITTLKPVEQIVLLLVLQLLVVDTEQAVTLDTGHRDLVGQAAEEREKLKMLLEIRGEQEHWVRALRAATPSHSAKGVLAVEAVQSLGKIALLP